MRKTTEPAPPEERAEEQDQPTEVGAPSEDQEKAGKDAGAPRKPLPAATGPAVTYESCKERIQAVKARSEEHEAKRRGK